MLLLFKSPFRLGMECSHSLTNGRLFSTYYVPGLASSISHKGLRECGTNQTEAELIPELGTGRSEV